MWEAWHAWRIGCTRGGWQRFPGMDAGLLSHSCQASNGMDVCDGSAPLHAVRLEVQHASAGPHRGTGMGHIMRIVSSHHPQLCICWSACTCGASQQPVSLQ